MSETKAPSGGKKKNQKKVTLSLQEFNKTIPEHDAQSQWGDIAINDDDDFEHHRDHQPSSDSSYNRRENTSNREKDNYPSRESHREQREPREPRESREPREPRERKQNEIPTHPPFVAYVGNLSFKVTKEQLYDFFSDNCQVEDVRLVLDNTTAERRSRGYGYITFKSRKDLETALTANDYDLEGRPIRVDVSTPRDNNNQRQNTPQQRSTFTRKEKTFEPSRADNADVWERGRVVTAKPVDSPPPRQKQQQERRTFNRRDSPQDSEGKEESKVRQPLKLQPRSSSGQEHSDADNSSKKEEENRAKPNPFGNAKPRDERAIEERRQKEIAERQKEDDPQTPPSPDPSPEEKPQKSSHFNNNNNSEKNYRAPRNNSNSGKSYNRSYNNNHHHNNNNNQKNQKKKGPRNEADSDGFVPTSKSASNPQPSQASTPAPSSGPAIKNKYSALSEQ